MNEELEAVNESTVAGLGRLARFFGFSDVMGRLYGTLLLHPGALSLDELADTLEISKGSVSMNMRALERWGMAKEVWMRGERKKYYRVEPDLWLVIRNILAGREQREVQRALEVLTESVEKLKTAESDLSPEELELSKFYIERLADLQAFFSFAQMGLETVLRGHDSLNFEAVTSIEFEQESSVPEL